MRMEPGMFSHCEFEGHEQVAFLRDPDSGLRAIIAVHSTALGPAFGGCRMRAYGSEADALGDVLRLSAGMTRKAAICGLPWGGGKAVIIGDPRRDKTPALLRAMGRAIERLGGRYIVADDVGITLEDLAVIRSETAHTAAASPSAQQPLAVTAYGVLMAIRAAVRHELERDGLAGLRVAVQGLGAVGFPLCGYLHGAGAELVVSDLDPVRIARAESAFGARGVDPEAIFEQPVDLFAPCALGGILTDETIALLQARIVCGGANNQLADASRARLLAGRDCLYVPDYLASAGGVIDFHQERIDDRPEAVMRAVGRIFAITLEVLEQARATGRTPLAVAEARVAERLATARTSRPAA
jgi:leucine dehydrogenase